MDPDPATASKCAACFKPIESGQPVIARRGQTLHEACWRYTLVLGALEEHERAREALATARDRVERAGHLLERRNGSLPVGDRCAICAQPMPAAEVAFWGRAKLHRRCLPKAPEHLARRGMRHLPPGSTRPPIGVEEPRAS
jgi:hypothetical protein